LWQAVDLAVKGLSAFAAKTGAELEQEWQREDVFHFTLEREWREEDIEHRSLEKRWRKIENKRRRVEEKTAQVALLARLSALMGGFQVAVFINQGVPALTATWPLESNSTESETVWTNNTILNDPVMCIWSLSAVGVITINFCIMVQSSLLGSLRKKFHLCKLQVMASIIQLDIVRATTNEGGGFVPEEEQYLLDGSRPDGLIVQVIKHAHARARMHARI
jgi:hypothetical protein